MEVRAELQSIGQQLTVLSDYIKSMERIRDQKIEVEIRKRIQAEAIRDAVQKRIMPLSRALRKAVDLCDDYGRALSLAGYTDDARRMDEALEEIKAVLRRDGS